MTSGKPRKPRSPAVPSRTLGDAIDDVKKIYDFYTHGSFSKAEIASALKMSAASGPFGARIFTLREYGLIEGSGDAYKVSQSFTDMNGTPRDQAKFKRRALEAVRKSEVFRELLDEWKTKLPPRDAVARRLEQQKRFNPDRAKAAAAILEESLKQAGVLDSSNNVMPIRDDAGARDPEEGSGGSGSMNGELEEEIAEKAMLRTEIPLSEGRRVVVLYPTDLSGDEATKVGNVLGAIVS